MLLLFDTRLLRCGYPLSLANCSTPKSFTLMMSPIMAYHAKKRPITVAFLMVMAEARSHALEKFSRSLQLGTKHSCDRFKVVFEKYSQDIGSHRLHRQQFLHLLFKTTNHIPISLIFAVTFSILPSISVPVNFGSFRSLTIFPSRINIIRSVRAATLAS